MQVRSCQRFPQGHAQQCCYTIRSSLPCLPSDEVFPELLWESSGERLEEHDGEAILGLYRGLLGPS
eukprot:390024-Pyramimonas_sp.AAC.1